MTEEQIQVKFPGYYPGRIGRFELSGYSKIAVGPVDKSPSSAVYYLLENVTSGSRNGPLLEKYPGYQFTWQLEGTDFKFLGWDDSIPISSGDSLLVLLV